MQKLYTLIIDGNSVKAVRVWSSLPQDDVISLKKLKKGLHAFLENIILPVISTRFLQMGSWNQGFILIPDLVLGRNFLPSMGQLVSTLKGFLPSSRSTW